MRTDALKLALNNIYDTYHRPEFSETDPVTFVRRLNGAPEREITGVLKKIAPGDPVKYDFSLYKYGMNNHETGENR
jgi:hypothetical protein